jgi:hypothetical protein
MPVGRCGARRGGRLKDANTVNESRSIKSAYVGGGMGRVEAVEKSLVKCESFQSDRERLAVDVLANFIVPCVVADAGFARTVDRTVSMPLAHRYVPPYTL